MKRVVGASVVMVAASVGVAINASPAHAVAGLQYVTSSTAGNSTSPKSLAITCPSGTVAINGGAYISGAVGSVTIRQLVPMQLFGLHYLSVVAQEDPDGYAGSWSVHAIAVCISPPAGLSYVSASVTDPYLVWATASCGTKRIIGSGYRVSDTAVAKAAGAEIDSRNRAYLSVEPSAVPGAIQPLTGTAVAVCANAPLPGQQQVSASTAMNSTNGKSAFKACPTGTRVIGVGGDLYGWRAHTIIDDFTISPATNSVTVTGYEDQVGNPDNWAVEAYALCAT